MAIEHTPLGKTTTLSGFLIFLAGWTGISWALIAKADPPSSYSPVVIKEDFKDTLSRMEAAKPDIMKRQMALLEERYDLSDKPRQGITMSRGKAIQSGVRVKLPNGMTSEKLAAMSPDEIRDQGAVLRVSVVKNPG